MGSGIITNDGRIFKAELYKLADAASSPLSARGLFWCAIGSGDSSFTDPLNPPAEDPDQTGLKNELIRKKFTTSQFLVETSGGAIVFGARTFNVSVNPTNILMFEFLFDFTEANFTWKEIGYFGGDVAFGQFYNGSAPPVVSGISGITINFVSPQNGTGSGTLAYLTAGTTITWKAPGSATAGPAINIGAGGNFVLTDGADVTKTIRIVVVAGSLPLSNQSVTPAIAAPGDVALTGLNSPTRLTGQVARNGRLFIVRTINDQPKTSAISRPPRLLIEP